jgi:hypothetical protein
MGADWDGGWGQCKEVQALLSENYVEDDDASFRLHYSKEFLHWYVHYQCNPDWLLILMLPPWISQGPRTS